MYSGEDVRQRQQYSAAQRACDEHTLYVKCVPKSMTVEDVRNLFSPYGVVVNCKKLENDGRFPTNRALVGMSSTDDCNAAICGLHGREVGREQCKIYVEFKKPSRYAPNSLPWGAQTSIRGYHLEGRSGYYSEGRGGFSGMYNTDNSGTQLEMSPYYQHMPEYSVWYRHTGEPEIGGILRSGTLSSMTVSDIQRDVGDNYITHLRIEGDIPDRLSELTPHLEQLQLWEIPDIKQLDRLAELRSLQVLNMRWNKFSSGVTPAVIGKLTNLRELNLTLCGHRDLHEGLADLKSLQVLHLSYNKFSSGVTPEVIGNLTNLRELSLIDCGLTDLHEGLADLKSLQVLHLSYNKFSSGVTPEVIGNLTNLRELSLIDCGLTDLHEGISNLQHLEELNLSRNRSLHTLSPDLMNLPYLEDLNCRGCVSLKSPPSAVCQQGLDAIRKYYKDLAEQRGKQLPIVSAAVIGNRMAGKTSLIRSLIDRKRVLTDRDDSAENDETTKVFEINEVPLSDMRLRMFDYGGDKVYHVAHQLAIRSKIIPLVVVNMEQYDELSADPKEAARQLCMDYMSHLYLPCPTLGAPLLILTHRDKFSDDLLFFTRKDQLIESAETLRQEMLQEERLYSNSNSASRFCLINHFNSTNEPIFHPDDIFVFSNLDEVDVIQSLTQKLEERSREHVEIIPYLWELMRQYLDDKQDIPFIILSELLAKFPEEGNLIILRYLHNDGRVLWFEREPSLQPFVFHRMSVIIDIVISLFHHKSSETWTCKMNSLPTTIPFKKETVSKLKYTELVDKFLRSGVVDEALLVSLYDSEGFDSQVAISLLQAFHLVCGPIKSKPRSTFIVPHLSPDLIDLSPINDKLLPLRVRVQFIGLSPPPYVYSLLTCIFLTLFVIPGCQIRSLGNGAEVHHGHAVCRLLHNYKTRRVTVQIDTPVEQLDTSWELMIKILDKMLLRLMSIWVAARPICEFFCAHCLYTQEVDPDRLVDPDWYSPMSHTDTDKLISYQVESFSGVRPVHCSKVKTTDRTLTVPLPLRYPCLSLSDAEKRVVQKYITGLDNYRQATRNTSSGVDPRVDDRCIEEIVTIMRDGEACIDLHVSSVTDSSHIPPDQPIYEMTKTRGRALILSNRKGRAGSQHDHRNMELMLERFGFVVQGEHKDYTAEEFVEAIHKETQMVDNKGESIHKDLGMFVLVITSHGAENEICGSDRVRIRLPCIRRLLSPKNFPAMKGKPKVIILQTCGGSGRDKMMNDTTGHVNTPADDENDDMSDVSQEKITTNLDNEPFESDDDSEDLETADSLIMQASSLSYKSYRNPTRGSSFIRAVVTTFYKHAHNQHIEALAEIVREAVNRYSVEKTARNKSEPGYTDKADVGQMPATVCSFTRLRKLYLNPGENIRTPDHSPSITNAVYPRTRIKWNEDVVTTQERGTTTITYVTKSWKVEVVKSNTYHQSVPPSTSTASTTTQQSIQATASTSTASTSILQSVQPTTSTDGTTTQQSVQPTT